MTQPAETNEPPTDPTKDDFPQVFKALQVPIEIMEDDKIKIFDAENPAINTPCSDIRARIFVVQGDGSFLRSLEHSGQQIPKLPSAFIDMHLQQDDIEELDLRQGVAHEFFASWSRLVSQEEAGFRIEQRIRASRPYDIDTIDDPWYLRLDHERYFHWPVCPFRPYGLISTSEERNGRHHAAKERISFFYSNDSPIFTGVLLVDPPRHHLVRRYKFRFSTDKITRDEGTFQTCFQEDRKLGDGHSTFVRGVSQIKGKLSVGLLGRLLTAMEQHDGERLTRDPANLVKTVLAQLVREDLSCVLREMSRALDFIELSLYNDVILQDYVSAWREQLGQWRNTLLHQITSIKYLHQAIATMMGSSQEDSLKENFLALTGELERTSRRIENTFQALMSSMSIAESERAIKEAEVVTKLTQLAFFFIPLSLVAGVFGMNINEFQGQLKLWIWALASIAASGVTYIALYWRHLLSILLQATSLVRGLSAQRISKVMIRWISILRFIIRRWPSILGLGILAGFSVGIWQLAAGSTNAGLGICIGIGVPTVSFLLLLFYWRKAKFRHKIISRTTGNTNLIVNLR